jgi:hypothetical protein
VLLLQASLLPCVVQSLAPDAVLLLLLNVAASLHLQTPLLVLTQGYASLLLLLLLLLHLPWHSTQPQALAAAAAAVTCLVPGGTAKVRQCYLQMAPAC